MARKPLAEAQWRVLRDEMRDVMVETARQGQLITYSELCAQLKTAYLHYHSPQIVRARFESAVNQAKYELKTHS